MKKLLFLAIALMSLSSFALNEGLSDMDLIKLSGDKDVQLQSLKDFFQQEKMNADAGFDRELGRQMAYYINSAEAKIKDIDSVLFPEGRSLTEDDLRNIDFNALQATLDALRSDIEEINP